MAALLIAAALGAVQPLTAANFDAAVTPDTMWLVKFYAPWCGHCKRLAPILEEMSESPEMGDAKIAKVDCTVEKKVCDRYEVKGFPTVYVMHQGHKWEHRGPRTKDSIGALLTRMRQPPVRELKTRDDLRAAMEAAAADDTALFVLGEKGGGSSSSQADALRQSFRATARARQHKDTFAETTAPDVVAALFATAGTGSAAASADGPFIVRVESGEAPVIFTATDAPTADLVDGFVEARRLPVFSVVDPSNFHQLAGAGRPLVLLTLAPPTVGVPSGELHRAAVDALAPDAAGPILPFRELARADDLQKGFVFALLDFDANEEHVNSTYFVTRAQAPALVVLRKDGGGRAFSVGSASADGPAMRAFLEGVLAGRARFEYEGMWGAPDRAWRIATRIVPSLHALDFLPAYTFSGTAALSVAGFLIWLIFFVGSEPHDPSDLHYRPPRPTDRARTKKVD